MDLSAHRRTAWLVFAVGFAVSLLLLVHRLDTGGDNLDFILLARSIQQGQWLDALSWPRPPGYSAVIASVLRVAGHDLPTGPLTIDAAGIQLLKALNVLLFAFSCAAVWAWSRRVSGSDLMGLCTGLVWAVNQTIAARSSVISAEPLFVLIAMGALSLWERQVGERDGGGRRAAIAFAAVAGLSIFVKYQGLALAGGLVLWILVTRRFRLRPVIQALAVGLAAGLAFFLQWIGNRFCLTHVTAPDPYGFGETITWAARLRAAFRVYTGGWADLLVPKILDDHGLLDLARLGFLAPVFVAAICLLLLVGFGVTARRRFTLAHAYLLCFGGMLVLWPDHLSRYLVPVVPVGIWLLLEGVGALAALVKGARPSRVVAAVAGALILWSLATNGFAGVKNWRNIARLRDLPPWHPARYEISREDDFADYLAAGLWMRDNTPTNAVIFCRKALFIELASGRRAVYYSAYSTPEELWAAIEASAGREPCFVLRDSFSAQSTYGRVRRLKLEPVLETHAAAFERLHRTAGGSEILQAGQR